MTFYDDDWKELQRRFPLVAKKIEELRCEVLNYEQYQEEKKELEERVKKLEKEG